MRQIRSAVCLFLAASLLSSCGSLPVMDERTMPQGYPTKDLKLALVVSEQTRVSTQRVREACDKSAIECDPSTFFEEMSNVIAGSFKTIIRVDSVDSPAARKADIIGVLDIDAKAEAVSYARHMAFMFLAVPTLFLICPHLKETLDISGKASFMTPDRKPIDAVSFEWSWSCGPECLKPLLQAASVELPWQLADGLARSKALEDYARNPSKPAPPPEPVRQAKAPAAATASGVDAPSYKAAEDPRAFALVIGIEKYASLPEARFAERDAEAVSDHLLALGVPARNILTLTGERAGRAAIEKYVESWLPRNAAEDSRVIVFFAGNGAPDPDTRQAYLVPYDGDPKFLKNTGYPLKRLYEKLGALKAKEIIVALDTSFSGAGGRSVLPDGARPLVTKVDTGEDAAGRLVVLSASAADEGAGIEEGQAHGLFTYHFLSALNERKGELTARQLYDSLLPRIKDAARRAGREQTVQIIPAEPGQRDAIRLVRPR